MKFSPYDYAIHEDPFATYRWLRDEQPLYRNEEVGFWALSRHADVLEAFKRTDLYSNAQGVSLERSSQGDATAVASFLAMDPPRHDHLRALVSKGFTPRRVNDLEPEIRRLARRYVGSIAANGGGDLIGDFAGKLPMDVISALLGVPDADRDTLRQWADTVLHREEGNSEIPEAGIAAAGSLLGYFQQLVADRRKSPTSDLPSGLMAAEVDGQALADRDVIAFLFLMIIAGNETTTKLLGNAVNALWRHPEQRQMVRADAGRIPAWVEETLRYDSSTQMLARTVTQEVTLHGGTMQAGDKLVLLVGSANRDERVFVEADRFDIQRDTSQHLAFGKGTHFCLGSSMARLEARVALEELMATISHLEVDFDRMQRVHSPNVRGFSSIPVRLA